MKKTSRSASRLVALGLLALAAVLTTAGTGLGAFTQGDVARAGANGGIEGQLERVKAALDKYKSVKVAEADGYVAASPCLSTATDPHQTSYGGGMGLHYVNEELLMSGKVIAKKPPVLLYAPVAGGGLELVAAEWFKPDADQDVTTDGDRPTLFDRAFDGPMLGHGGGMPVHFDLHVWLWKRNPSGIFSSWNPAVVCPGAENHASGHTP